MVSKKSLNLLAYTIFVVSKPESNNTGTIIQSGFKITTHDVEDSLITVIRNDGNSKSIKSRCFWNEIKIFKRTKRHNPAKACNGSES